MFKLCDSMLTGSKPLDEGHGRLIELINSFAEAEVIGSSTILTVSLSRFLSDLTTHFREEEDFLKSACYPKYQMHVQHHKDVAARLKQMIGRVENSAMSPAELAAECYHEIISTVLRYDMDFANWLADQPLAKNGKN